MPEKNELDWEEYEAITQYIYGALGKKYGIKVIGYGRNCKVKGKSGISYQIDVLTAQPDGGDYSRAASQDVTWSSGMRSCAIVSRSRIVTASSSSVSKSTVMQYGVPISSWRR